MQTTQTKYSCRPFITMFLSALLLMAGDVAAQQTAAAKAAKAEKPKRAIQAASARQPTLSKALQNSLEAGDTREALKLCGSECQQDPSMTLSAGSTGETRDYTCNGGNCACAGAADCVAMAPICQEGTMGCNDYGCTCKEDESGDGGG